MSESFKRLGKLAFLKKGTPLPDGITRRFNEDPGKVLRARDGGDDWFDGPARIALDEEVIGLGSYGYTLTVLSSEDIPEAPEDDEDERLEKSWTPKFAYGR
ncbi:MAG: hypothetical protein ACYC0C_17220 [Devosia sp.]